jgi:hypothetical protein
MRASLTHSVAVLVFLLTTHVVCAHAEDGSAAWLRYAPIPDAAQYARLPSRLSVTVTTASSVRFAQRATLSVSSLIWVGGPAV